MIAPLVLALSLLGAADDLAPREVKGLKISVPAAWKHKFEEGSERYDAPSEDASFKLFVMPVSPKRTPEACVGELLKALLEPGWEKTPVAKSAGAKRVVVEKFRPEEGKEPFELETVSYLGCNGSTKFLLTMTMSAKKHERFSALTTKIVDSLSYVK